MPAAGWTVVHEWECAVCGRVHHSTERCECAGRAPTLDVGAMSLRDYFAAHAIVFVLEHSSQADRVARRAYEIADALLVERNK